MSTPFTPDEVGALSRGLRDGAELSCPRCGVTLDRRVVPPRPDVSYMRDRTWVVCPRCARTAVLDRRESR